MKIISYILNWFLTIGLVFNTQVLFSQELSLEDLWLKGSFRSSMIYDLNWHPSEPNYLNSSFTDGIYSLKKTNISGISSDWISLNSGPYDGYTLSPDTNILVVWNQEEAIYRRSSRYHAYLYNRKNKTLEIIGDTSAGKISNLSFSPRGDKLAYCKKNNLFIYDVKTQKETAITSDGKFNYIIHGATDWVYEEEFEFAKAYVWTADGAHLAWYRFDETKVKEYNLQYFNETYPTDYRFKYPKAGETNSEVTLFLYSLISDKTIEITPSNERDLYYPRMYATNDPNFLLVFELNRTQNHLKIHRYDLKLNKRELMYEEKNTAYIEINDYLTFLPNSSSFVFTSERSGYRHLWQIEMGKSPKPLTKGSWEVSEFYGIHPDGKKCFYASNESEVTEQQVYSLNLTDCKTKAMTKESGWNDASFSNDYSVFLHTHSTLNQPPYISLVNVKTSESTELINNNGLKETMKSLALPEAKLMSIKIDTVSLNAWMLKPSDFDKSKKYPVFITVYGGPGNVSVSNHWAGYNYFWYQILASKGYVVLAVDGRGTGGKGEAFKKCTQGKLGQIECDDMVKVANYLSTLNYVDGSRIGIFGWSFGGYLSAMAITRGAPAFKAAIAVAPVTDWKFYDNIYTERYMNTPQNNPEGYKGSSVLTYAPKLSGNFLLIHGTGDDNVHVQHSMALQDALVNANKQFQSFFYPNKNHGIYGGYTRYHLYKMMTDFLEKNL